MTKVPAVPVRQESLTASRSLLVVVNLLRKRQICCPPCIVDYSALLRVGSAREGPKWDLFRASLGSGRKFTGPQPHLKDGSVCRQNRPTSYGQRVL